MQRWILGLILMMEVASYGAEVAWLADVQKIPVTSPLAARELLPLMSDESWRESDAMARWKLRRVELIEAWNALLGPEPARPQSNAIEVLQTEQLDRLTRKVIRYENEAGQFITAYLLEPIGEATPRPGVVALHATTDQTNRPIAGIGGRDDEQIGRKLAEQGFVVICPENFLWREAKTYDEAVAQFRQRYPKSLGIRKMLFDATRATDILASLPNVDSKRLGAIGHSLGAKEVLYLMAFDSRISVGVFSEGGIELESTNWNAPWYLGSIVNESGFARNHHELLAFIAPRPFLVLGGEIDGAADGGRSWPYLATAMPAYKLYGERPRLGLLNHHEGHKLSSSSFERSAEWLRIYLEVDH